MKILIAGFYDADLLNRIHRIARASPDQHIETKFAFARSDQLREVEDAEILVPTFDRELFLKAKKLKWVHVFKGGVNSYLFPEFLESEIVLTFSKGITGTHMAEHAFGLLLGLTRGIASAVRYREWKNYSYTIQELHGKVMGIIGFGGVGREIASRAHAFGMKVIAVDINDVRKPDFIEEIWKPDHLPRLLQESDAVMIVLPLTDRTRGLFNQELFRQMKRTPFLINVSRGEIMDMNALIEALEEGWIAGAGLDVAPEEPLPSENPLWKMENVVITPHIAGLSPMRMQRNWELFLENLRRWVNKEPLLSLFDRQQRF